MLLMRLTAACASDSDVVLRLFVCFLVCFVSTLFCVNKDVYIISKI